MSGRATSTVVHLVRALGLNLLVVALILATAWAVSRLLGPEDSHRAGPRLTLGPGRGSFPAVATEGLSPLRRRIIDLARQEHANPRPGVFYSQGEQQDWCANFVSWTMHQAGAPMTNPHTGAWRIPGVRSLQTAYQQAGRWHPAGSGYHPQPGDAILYDTRSRLGEHVNIFLGNDPQGRAITVGGNEANAIHVAHRDLANLGPIRGYGAAE